MTAAHPAAPSALLASRRFAPLFATQMLGALNDNLFKNALVVLILFRGSADTRLVPIAGGLFVLPYALFSALAGQLADRYPKHRLLRLTKSGEVALMAIAAAGLLLGSEPFLLAVLFGLGVQAAFFGPLKYGVLPELLPPEQLLAGNGLIEASTFIGILIGTVLGGELILLPQGRWATAAAILLVAAAGRIAAGLIPAVPAAAPNLPIAANIAASTVRLLDQARRQPIVWLCILALSWFWALGAAFLAEFPVIVKTSLHAGGQVVTLMLAVFSVGVGAGSLLAARLLGGAISARPVVPAAIVLSLFALDFAWSSSHATGLNTAALLIRHRAGLRILADLFAVSVCGGVFSVPLYALLQARADPAWRARMVAANNVVNALAMVAAAILLAAGAALRLSPGLLLAVFAAANLVVAAALARARLP